MTFGKCRGSTPAFEVGSNSHVHVDNIIALEGSKRMCTLHVSLPLHQSSRPNGQPFNKKLIRPPSDTHTHQPSSQLHLVQFRNTLFETLLLFGKELHKRKINEFIRVTNCFESWRRRTRTCRAKIHLSASKRNQRNDIRARK